MTLEMQVLVLRLALIIGLYLFLLVVVVVAWRELRASAGTEKPAAEETVSEKRSLVVVDGSDTPLQHGDAFPLRPVTSLGRDPVNTIVIPDAGASAEHALISVRDGHWWLEDLGSTNGTFLNDIPIEAPVIVAPGDLIRVGHVKMKIE